MGLDRLDGLDYYDYLGLLLHGLTAEQIGGTKKNVFVCATCFGELLGGAPLGPIVASPAAPLVRCS